MKSLLYTCLLSFSFLSIYAQKIDRSKAPKPGPAPEIKIASPAKFTLDNGLKVFVVSNSKLPRVAATLTIDRDPLLEGEKAGLTSLAGSLMRRGTTKMNKAVLDETIDFLGADISTSSTSVSANALKSNFKEVMSLMADVVLQPSLPEEELEKLKKQMISGLESQKDDPNAISSRVSNVLMYGKNHPYGEYMTESSIQSVTVSDIKNYIQQFWIPNKAYLVFVGDITVAEAKALAEQHFEKWQIGKPTSLQYSSVTQPKQNIIAIVDRPSSVQSVINIVTPITLTPNSKDVIAASVMDNILGGSFSSRLFQNLREKYGFTYGAYSSVSPNKLTGSFSASASVRTEKTDSAIGQFLYEFNRLRNELADEKEVNAIKNYMSGRFARSLESPSTIARFALNVELNNLPPQYYQQYLTQLAAVNANQVQEMAKQYVPNQGMYIVIVGNAKAIANGLEKYGIVKYFDSYGNEVAAPTVKKVDENVTAAEVLKKSIEALGGEAALAAVKDVNIEGTASLMGQSLQYQQKNIVPNGYFSAIVFNGMQVLVEKKDGSTYIKQQQGMDMPIDAKAKEDLDEKAACFSELFWKNNGFKLNLVGIEQVDGKDAYQVEMVSPAGNKKTVFFDMASGLRVKEEVVEETPQGSITIATYFKSYTTINGVKFPNKLVIDQGQLKITLDLTSIKVNSGLTNADLK